VKTAISIPDPIFREAEETARRLGLSRSELYQRALRAYVKEHRGDGVTERLDRVYAGESSALDMNFVTMQIASVGDKGW
jgi:metal-responsive CopG/Arc/MetJ family transcriptional regulator